MSSSLGESPGQLAESETERIWQRSKKAREIRVAD